MGKRLVQSAGRGDGRAGVLLPCAGADKQQRGPRGLKGCVHTAIGLSKGPFVCPSPRTNPEES